jgi:outer membrane protein assembly factor BamB
MITPMNRNYVAVFLWATTLAGGVILQAADPAEQWPGWRGPLGTGLALASAKPPLTWSETNNVRWKVKIPGRGTATPIVWENLVFVQTALPTGKKVEAAAPAPSPQPSESAPATGGGDANRRGRGGMGAPKPTEVHQFVLLCLDRQTGKTLWQQVAREEVPHEGHHRTDGTFASSSPVTDGQRVFAYFGSRGLHCYDLQGKLQWSQDFGDMRIAMSFGEGSSPGLHGNTLVVTWDHEGGDSFIIALDKTTGKTLWKKPRPEKTSWATPLFVQQDGKTQVIASATGKIRGYDLATGEVIWECGGLTANVIPTPVAGDGFVYCASGFRGNALLAIRLGGQGDLTGTDAITWRVAKATPYVPSPLLYQGRLYCFSGNNGLLSCFEAKTGKPLLEAERLEAFQNVYASPIAAAGRIYFLGRNGATVVIKPSDKLEILSTNKLEERTDASPVAVGGDLLIRGQEWLYCLAEQ